MRLLYNPKYIGDRTQAWKSFLAGSMVASSLIFLAFAESVPVFFAALAMIAIGILLFIFNNMNFTRATYLAQNVFSAVLGLVVSLVFHASGFLLLYLGLVVILVLVTWLHRFMTPGKTGQNEPEKKNSEKPPETPGG